MAQATAIPVGGHADEMPRSIEVVEEPVASAGTAERATAEAETMSRVQRLVRDYDANSVTKQVRHLRRMQAREMDMAQLQREDSNRTQMLKRQISGMALRGGISADEVAMVAGLVVGAALVGGFGFGMPSRQMKSKQRAARIDGLCERAHARVDRGECFLPVVGHVLPRDVQSSLNEWFCNTAEPRLRTIAHETLAHEHVPLSLETIGSQGLAIELDALRQLMDPEHPVPYTQVRRQYQERMDGLVELAHADGITPQQVKAAMVTQSLKLTDESGRIDFGSELSEVIGKPTPEMLRRAEAIVAQAELVQPFATGTPTTEVASYLCELFRTDGDAQGAPEAERTDEPVAEASWEAGPMPVDAVVIDDAADDKTEAEDAPYDIEDADVEGMPAGMDAETVTTWQVVIGADGARYCLDKLDEHGQWQSDYERPDDMALLEHVDLERWQKIPQVTRDADHIVSVDGQTQFTCGDGTVLTYPVALVPDRYNVVCDISAGGSWSSDLPGFEASAGAFCAKNGIYIYRHETVDAYLAELESQQLDDALSNTHDETQDDTGLSW